MVNQTDNEGKKQTNPPSSLATEITNQMKEWEKAREIFKDYDERLHDLRKYGFSFLTALLTIGSLVTQTITSKNPDADVSVAVETQIPGLFGLGCLLIVLVLIVALHLLDKNYREFQKAVYTRVSVIERNLNIELSEAIQVRHKHSRINLNVYFVYSLFIIGVAVLGGLILSPDWNLIWWLITASAVAWIVITVQSMILGLQFANKGFNEDWTISPLECTGKDTMRITLNNFKTRPFQVAFKEYFLNLFKVQYQKFDDTIKFSKDNLIWEIIDEYGEVAHQEKAKGDITVYENYVWVLSPHECLGCGIKRGVYRLRPRDWNAPLPISIIVHGPPDPEPDTKPKKD